MTYFSHLPSFFFFNDTATTEIYTLSLHDALPILFSSIKLPVGPYTCSPPPHRIRSEEHTSELQSHSDLVCRLLLEKKKKSKNSMLFVVNAMQKKMAINLLRIPVHISSYLNIRVLI